MPMRWKRAKFLAKSGKAVFVKTKSLGLYLKLKYKPSGEDLQDINLGLDPGTFYNGFSVVSSKSHNLNIQRNAERVKSIRERVSSKSEFRKLRRSLLWHRPARFSSRTGKKLAFSIKYLWEVKLQMVKDICKIYPISKLVIEDVRFNHFRSRGGSLFSHVEVGKNWFLEKVSKLITKIDKLSGYETSLLRDKMFKRKVKDSLKSNNSFYTHCVDSFVIANRDFNLESVNLSGTIISEKVRSKRTIRRGLREFTAKARFPRGGYKNNFRWKKGSLRVDFLRWTNVKKVRVKLSDAPSNHGPWRYLRIEKQRIGKRNFLSKSGDREFNKFLGRFSSKNFNPETGFHDSQFTFIPF